MYSGIYLHGYAFIQIEVITGFQIQFKEIRIIFLMRIKVILTGGQNVIPVIFMGRVCHVLTLPE